MRIYYAVTVFPSNKKQRKFLFRPFWHFEQIQISIAPTTFPWNENDEKMYSHFFNTFNLQNRIFLMSLSSFPQQNGKKKWNREKTTCTQTRMYIYTFSMYLYEYKLQTHKYCCVCRYSLPPLPSFSLILLLVSLLLLLLFGIWKIRQTV